MNDRLAVRTVAPLLAALLLGNHARGQFDKTGILEQRVHIDVSHNGNTAVDFTDGTQGGAGPDVYDFEQTAFQQDDYRVDGVEPYQSVHAVSEGTVSRVDDLAVLAASRKLDYGVATNAIVMATGVPHPQEDAAVAEAESFALVNVLEEAVPTYVGSSFRYSLTWFASKTPLSAFTDFENTSFVDIDGVLISEAPNLDPGFDTHTIRKSEVFVRDPSRANDPLPVIVSSYVRLAHKYPPDVPPEELDSYYLDYPQQYTEFIILSFYKELAGTNQTEAIKPNGTTDFLAHLFENVPTGLWFDPTPANGFTYDILDDDVLFDEILDFPTGLDGPVTVSADGQDLGQYGPGDSLSFSSLLGHGVDQFDVTGISPFAQVEDSPGFALQLGFSEATASFTMTAHPVQGVGQMTMWSPVAVVDTNLGEDTPLVNMIDQSGLEETWVDGQTSFDVYFAGDDPPAADVDYNHYWQSSESLDDQIEGFVEFDLGELLAVDRLAIWSGTLLDISVLVAATLDDPWQEVGEFSLENHNPLLFTEVGPQILDLGGAHDVRYVRIDIDSTYPLLSQFPFETPIIAEIAASVSPPGSSTDLPGDFNGDGVADGVDFLEWQRGESPNPFSGNDLADWVTNFGATSASDAARQAPEPPTIALLLAGLATVVLRWILHYRPVLARCVGASC